MTLDDLVQDIYALEDEMRAYQRKYGVLSETFYDAYLRGEEPPDDAWVQDWTAWASAYKLWLRRIDQYRSAVRQFRTESPTLVEMIEKTARHERIPITS